MQTALGTSRGWPVAVGHHHVEVVDLAEAVAPEHQRVGLLAQQVLARVEVVLPEVNRPRVGVRHDHLGDGRAVDQRPFPASVGERDLVQDQALARVEADPEPPVLPRHHVVVDLEAGTLGLGDLQWPQRGAGRPDVRGVVEVALLRRHGQQLVVDELDDALLGEVDVRDDAVDRMRPAVVLRPVLQEGQHAQHAAALLAGDVEVAGGQRDTGEPGRDR